MKKAKLIKKDSPLQEQIRQAKKTRKVKGKKEPVQRTAVEVTRQWLEQRSKGSAGAREAFASLFGEGDPQSA